MADTFLVTGLMPSRVSTYPRSSTSFIEKNEFLAFTLRLASLNLQEPSFVWGGVPLNHLYYW